MDKTEAKIGNVKKENLTQNGKNGWAFRVSEFDILIAKGAHFLVFIFHSFTSKCLGQGERGV
jgi:hypothetical protein